MTRVEGENTRLRHYLARLKRKTLCYSKSLEMLEFSIKLLLHYLKYKTVPVQQIIPYFSNAEDHPQIIVPKDASAGFRAGVLAPIPPNLTEEIHNIEYPVYGKYNGKSLSKIFINYKENWVVS